MTRIPELQRLARQCTGDPEAALVQVLRLLCEQLDVDLAVLGDLHDDLHTVRLAVGVEGRLPALEGSRPVGESWCGHVPQDGPLVVRDVADAPAELRELDVTAHLDVQCYVGTMLPVPVGRTAGDGTAEHGIGVLGVVGHRPHDRLDERDLAVLEGLAEVAAELYAAYRSGAVVVPSQRRPVDLADIADAVSRAEDLEELTRPLLEALHDLSGIASTYLTVVREDLGTQEIRFSLNRKDRFEIPEGVEVPWEDTLCKRALDEGRTCTTDVPGVWGDSEAAAQMGIVTYVSVPVRLGDGRVWGTLCAADDVRHEDAAQSLPTLSLFARLIATEVERAAAISRERARASRARYEADTDELTGCSSRRTVQPWLVRALDGRRAGEVVLLAFVDVDRFKAVNDHLGHATGDALLATLGTRLLGSARPGDLVARLGGDEFVVGACVPREALASVERRIRDAGHFVLSTAEGALPVRCSTGLATSDDAADPAALLSLSDAEMYRDKALART